MYYNFKVASYSNIDEEEVQQTDQNAHGDIGENVYNEEEEKKDCENHDPTKRF